MSVTRGYGILEKFLAEQRVVMANKLIRPESRQGRLLDIGCGNHPFFLLRTDFEEKYGLDKIEHEEASLKKQNIRLVNFDAEKQSKLPFDDGFFDIVTMLAVFEHIEPAELPVLLREIHRVLKPGGTYLLTTPAAWTDSLLRLMARARLVSPIEIQEHKDAYTHEKIRQVLQKTPFVQGKTRFGYFECFMNIWAAAEK